MKNLFSISVCLLLLLGCSKEKEVVDKTTIVSKKNILQKVTIAGNVEPKRKVSIVPLYDGYIKEIFVKLGQNVIAGDKLITVGESLEDNGPLFPLKAPFSGKVVQVNKNAGEYVRKSEQENQILRIDDVSNLYVYAKAPELDYLKIKVGQQVSVRATAILDRQYKGKVTEVFFAAVEKERGWGSSSQSAEYPVKIEILDEDDRLKPGMTTIVDIVAEKRDDVLALPHDYIFTEKGETFVSLSDGKRKKIKTGLRDEFFVEVIGLEEGARIQQVDFYKAVDKK